MTCKKDHEHQKIDPDACYLPSSRVAQMSGRSRATVFRDIKAGALPAVWGSVVVDDRKNRSWLVHPRDAQAYVEKHLREKELPSEVDRLRDIAARYHWLCANLARIHIETTQPAGSPADTPMVVTLIQAWPNLPRTDTASVDEAVRVAMREGV
ncbi:hypothetical protein [Azohydromonas lata]|uniref:hypothetical protein n=1 Tax=Azohydromonas lata TaxID=45677 RepID=UPI0008355110|nr:hypothetical protein [Azohydromonas lata]